MATKREEAQKRRAEERQKRRGNSQPDETSAEQEEPLETVKHAAKVAAAAAAVGAAMGAARAMTGGGHDGDEPEQAPEQEAAPAPEAASEPEQPEQPQQPEEPEQPEQPRQPRPRARQEEREEPVERPSGASPSEARRVVETAREQLAALLGKEPDSISGLDRSGDHWIVTLEVVELARIPESTDVLASYEVELDGDRNLVRYTRRRRYYRSQADDGDAS
jgi:Gas vesicle synthesis protein GvpO